MPIYEYQCNSCGSVFEVRQKFSDSPLTEHDNCGGAVRRLLSAPALQFKGSGWYITDYAKGGTSSQKAGESKPESSTDSTKKTDSTPATTAPASTPAADKK
jgi:putative FmdB family regulatory protein